MMNKPQYIWSKPEWPHFYHNVKDTAQFEQSFRERFLQVTEEFNHYEESVIHESCVNLGIIETVYTSRIEGVNLNTHSIFESYINNVPPKREEKNALELLRLAIENIHLPLTHSLLKKMHRALLPEIKNSGVYVGGMKIIEGNELMGQEKLIYRGVPKERVDIEMDKFLDWFNNQPPETPLTNAIQGHLYFESIHPFPDGNGRIGRTILLMGICRDFQTKIPLALSRAIEDSRNDYYKMFDNRTFHHSLDFSPAIHLMHPIFMRAIEHTTHVIKLSQIRLLTKNATLNSRQEKVMNRLIQYELSDGFKGGLSNENYCKMAHCEHKTAQRDLLQLKKLGLLISVGKLKTTRYFLPLEKVLN